MKLRAEKVAVNSYKMVVWQTDQSNGRGNLKGGKSQPATKYSTVVIFSSTLHIHSWIINFFPLSISSRNILHSSSTSCTPSLKMLSSAAVIILFAHCQKCHNTDCYTSHWSSNPQKPELITNPQLNIHASKPRQVATLKKGDLILGPRELLTLHGGDRR